MTINKENFIEQLHRKNEDALYYVIDIYGGLIKSIVSRHLYKLKPLQEECIDDILMAVWDNIDVFCPEKNSFKNWVAAIAKYKSIDYKRRYLKLLEQENIEGLNLASSWSGEKAIMEQELSQEMESLLSHLSENDREIFKQYYVEDQEVETIAQAMRVKESNVYNRLSRGRARLRKIYGSRQL